jgi:phospho-N-acetylmuramoyl-pentapeptide-transferase
MGAAGLGFGFAFLISVAAGGPIIRALTRVGARQSVSEHAPSGHQEKQGTPTMGGIIILLGLAVPVALALSIHPTIWMGWGLLGLTIAYGMIGLLDDYLIAKRGKNLGLRAREKMALQVLVAGGFLLLMWYSAISGRTTVFRLWSDFDLGAWYYPLGLLLIVGFSNALNFTDGLDGLASGISALIALALCASVYAGPGGHWLLLFGGGMAGACCGFLWFNAHPAQIFMGDTGSLALGAGLAGMAMVGKAEGPMQFFAIVPWVALFSVMIQVGVFKYRARKYGFEYARANRVFRRTPIHHHFEELGWKETKIVQRFWLITALSVAITLAVFAR